MSGISSGRSWSDEDRIKVLRMRDKGYSNEEIATHFVGRSVSAIRQLINRSKDFVYDGVPHTDIDSADNNKRVSMSQNGDMVFEGIISLLEGEAVTPEIIMKAHNLDASKWEIVSFTSNAWQSQVKGGNRMTLWQSKITVRSNTKNEISFEDIDKYFNKKKETLNIEKCIPFAYNDNDEVLEIDYADAHTGLLSWRKETGADYDLNIASERFKSCIADTVRRCVNKKFKKIIFATLGDILHIDNDKNETTAGTLQQADGRISKIFDCAVDMLRSCIDALLTLGVPIEYVYVSGNHDKNTGYCLAKSIEMAYLGNPNITFNISQNPQKAIVIGNNLIGLCHGDMSKHNLGEWLQKTYRKEFGATRFAEVHCGHLHSESTREVGGVLVKHLPTICESSYWEHQQGYRATRGTMCFIWNKNTGLRETWYNYI